VAAAVVGTVGACALLAACSTVKMGSAAVVGDQRITTATLGAQVVNVQQGITQYGVKSQIPAADMPRTVLTWLVRFAVTDRAAQDAGITVDQEQIQATLTQFNAQEKQAIESQGGTYPGLDGLLAANGIPPDQRTAFGKWATQQSALEAKADGGKQPTTQAEAAKVVDQLNVASCKAVKALNVQVNPQFGQLDYQVNPSNGQGIYLVTAGTDTLSRPAGKPSSAPPAPVQQPC
jgi:hypothetical protein